MPIRKTFLDYQTDQSRQSPPKSYLASTFKQEIQATLGENLFEGVFGNKISDSGAELYVSKRLELEPIAEQPNRFAVEARLHRAFWPKSTLGEPLVFLEGVEGAGKSTLVRFYFDGFLPNFENFSDEVEDGIPAPSSQELAKHLFLYVDCRRRLTAQSFEDRLYAILKKQILSRFPSVTVDEDMKMWSRVAHWDNPIYSAAFANLEERRSLMSRVAVTLFQDDKTFVQEALHYLAAHRENGDRTHYITLILDNLDQQEMRTQLHVLGVVLTWLGERLQFSGHPDATEAIDLWRVVIPVRPKTLRLVAPIIQPLERKIVIRVSEPDQDELISSRVSRLKSQIRNSRIQVDVIKSIPGGHIFSPVLNGAAASKVARIVTCDSLDSASGSVDQSSRHLLSNFCNGSTRRYLRMRRRIALHEGVERSLQEKFAVGRYGFISAMLYGAGDFFDSNDPDNDVLNLFSMTSQASNAYSVLVGPHVLSLLHRDHLSRGDILNSLRSIGYKKTEIEECLHSMEEGGVLNFSDVHDLNSAIDREARVVEAYWDLLFTPAYIDCLSICVPVTEAYAEAMHWTLPYDNNHFLRRTETTLLCLRQLCDDELTVSTWIKNSDRHSMSFTKFEDAVNELRLPSVYRRAASAVRERITRLRDGDYLQKTMAASDWDRLLGDQILGGADVGAVLHPHNLNTGG